MSKRMHHEKRSGNTLILTVLGMVGMFAVLALTVDVGYLYMVDSELQRTADAAALSGAWELYRQKELGHADPNTAATQTMTTASQYSQANTVGSVAPVLAGADVKIGNLPNPVLPDACIDTDPAKAASFNAVKVTVRRSEEVNGAVPLFFARVLGFTSETLSQEATAMYLNNFKGFRSPSSGNPNLPILPFALDENTWKDMLAGTGDDKWTWDEETKTVIAGGDDLREVNLFPQNTIPSAGNRGTVDIGASNNSTCAITEQIYNGISPQDLIDLGKPFEFDANGEMSLNGDTGISASVQKALNDIKGQTRMIPLFKAVAHPGNNAQYTISGLVGVRIMEADLNGSKKNKRVMVQEGPVQVRGGIPTTGEQKTQFIYSPVWLVR